MQRHPIFHQFSDYCANNPGEDKNWTVGTEHRQLQIYEKELRDPWSMKNMMVDHVKRRHFIIDADVKVRNFTTNTEKTSQCKKQSLMSLHCFFNALAIFP